MTQLKGANININLVIIVIRINAHLTVTVLVSLLAGAGGASGILLACPLLVLPEPRHHHLVGDAALLQSDEPHDVPQLLCRRPAADFEGEHQDVLHRLRQLRPGERERVRFARLREEVIGAFRVKHEHVPRTALQEGPDFAGLRQRQDQDRACAGVTLLFLLTFPHEGLGVLERRIAEQFGGAQLLQQGIISCIVVVRRLRVGAQSVAAHVEPGHKLGVHARGPELSLTEHVVFRQLVRLQVALLLFVGREHIVDTFVVAHLRGN